MSAWTPCALGCRLSHRPDDATPLHSPAWLESERVRLEDALREIVQRWQREGWCVLCDHYVCTSDCPVSIASRAICANRSRTDIRPDELGALRTAREVPRLTDASGPAGVSVDVGLAPTRKR